MSKFENKIYMQTPHSCVRNKVINNFNTSSDFCVFSAPTFNIDGAGKLLACSDTTNCSLTLSSNTISNLEVSAFTNCFLNNNLEDSCHENTHWRTKIYENGILSYSSVFHTTTTLSGDTPMDSDFSGSVITGFNTLGYDYDINGSTVSISKPYGVSKLDISLCVEFDLSDTCLTDNCDCPSGYTETIDGLNCVYSATTAATFNGSGGTISAGDVNTAYGDFGTYFYSNQSNNQSLPLYRQFNNTDLTDQSGGTITWTDKSDSSNSFWGTFSGIDGRLNECGISASTTEWLGFSHCVEVPTTGVYYIGIGADNFCRFRIDGNEFLELTGNVDRNFKIWHVLPCTLTAGKHIIEMEGRNSGLATAFGAEIYNPVDLATLTGATSTGDTGLLFSTANKVGDYFDVGTTIGYSCPTGWALESCSELSSEYYCIYMDEIPKPTDCICTINTACTINSVWTIDVNIGCEISKTYDFYSGSSLNTVPSTTDLSNTLTNIANDLGLEFNNINGVGQLSYTTTCDSNIYLNKSITIDLNLDVDVDCTALSKNFQNGDNFAFQNGIDYDFN